MLTNGELCEMMMLACCVFGHTGQLLLIVRRGHAECLGIVWSILALLLIYFVGHNFVFAYFAFKEEFRKESVIESI